jgi:hypothetical protein
MTIYSEVELMDYFESLPDGEQKLLWHEGFHEALVVNGVHLKLSQEVLQERAIAIVQAKLTARLIAKN